MNKRLIVVIIGFLWIAVAVGLIHSRQQIMRTGKSVILATVPVDPRDFLRGDYVVLQYQINTLDLSKLNKGYNKEYALRQAYTQGEPVYVTLAPSAGVWQAVLVSKKSPSDGRVFIKGRVQPFYSAHSAPSGKK